MTDQPVRMRRVALSGALAGVATVLLFTIVHQLTISNIWFSVVPMLIVGALCGLTLAWSYRVVFAEPGAWSWIRYNAAHLGALLMLGVLSVLVFEPITTAAAIMAAGGPPPPELFQKALPFTAVFTMAAAGAMSAVWARSPGKAGAVLTATVVLVFLFGLNISILGLVEMSGEGYRALAEFLGLTVLVLVANTGFFLLFERRGLFGGLGGAEGTGGTEDTEDGLPA